MILRRIAEQLKEQNWIVVGLDLAGAGIALVYGPDIW